MLELKVVKTNMKGIIAMYQKKSEFLKDETYLRRYAVHKFDVVDLDEDEEDEATGDYDLHKEENSVVPDIDDIKKNIIDSTTFDDIIGYDKIKKSLNQVLDFIKDPTYYISLGCETPKGILLFGKAGIGKTMIASAFINASKLTSYIVNRKGTNEEFNAFLAKVFEDARKNQPCIILLDDIDKFSHSSKDNGVFFNLQSLIDSVRHEKIYIIATANDFDRLPRSLIRDGRFDTKIMVSSINDIDSSNLIKAFIKDMKLSNNIELEDIVSMTEFKTPVEIKNTLNKVCMHAAYNRKIEIDIDDFAHVFVGIDDDCSNEWKKKEGILETAYHEAGHAVIMEAYKKGTVGFITIMENRQERFGGFTKPKILIDSNKINTIIDLGGKAAVELSLPITGSGCLCDIENAKDHIMERLNTNGSFNWRYVANSDRPGLQPELEEATSLLFTIYEKTAKKILIENKELLKAIVDGLMEKGYLLYSDIKKIEEEHPVKPFPFESIA